MVITRRMWVFYCRNTSAILNVRRLCTAMSSVTNQWKMACASRMWLCTQRDIALFVKTQRILLSEEKMYELEFKPTSVIPSYDPIKNDYLIVNYCEGYALAHGSFDECGNFLCFTGWVAGEFQTYHPNDYSYWALLPSSCKVTQEN